MPCEGERGDGGRFGWCFSSLCVRTSAIGGLDSQCIVCQGCRWRGIAVRSTTGSLPTVPLTLYSIPTLMNYLS